jgi:hypothetical protein
VSRTFLVRLSQCKFGEQSDRLVVRFPGHAEKLRVFSRDGCPICCTRRGGRDPEFPPDGVFVYLPAVVGGKELDQQDDIFEPTRCKISPFLRH